MYCVLKSTLRDAICGQEKRCRPLDFTDSFTIHLIRSIADTIDISSSECRPISNASSDTHFPSYCFREADDSPSSLATANFRPYVASNAKTDDTLANSNVPAHSPRPLWRSDNLVGVGTQVYCSGGDSPIHDGS